MTAYWEKDKVNGGHYTTSPSPSSKPDGPQSSLLAYAPPNIRSRNRRLLCASALYQSRRRYLSNSVLFWLVIARSISSRHDVCKVRFAAACQGLSFDGSASFMVITMKEERGFLRMPEAASLRSAQFAPSSSAWSPVLFS